MAPKVFEIARINANITAKDFHHVAQIELCRQISVIARRLTILVKKKIPGLSIVRDEISYGDGYASIRIHLELIDESQKGQMNLFGTTIDSVINEIDRQYHNALVQILAASDAKCELDFNLEIKSTIDTNKELWKLKCIDKTADLILISDEQHVMKSIDPESLCAPKVDLKINSMQIIEEEITGYVVTSNIKPNRQFKIPDDTLLDVIIYTSGSVNRVYAKLPYQQILSIVVLSSKLSGNVSYLNNQSIPTLVSGLKIHE